jgi:hypothetical protein
MYTYGDVKTITEEQCSRAYRYSVSKGIRIVEIGLKSHILSHMMVVGYRVLISYEGQPLTCYRCNEPGHQSHECPQRRKSETPN